MNNDLLRLFETESDYDSAKPDFVYPTVSYVKDVDEVRYMEAPQPLLPIIDTTGYATEFVDGEYYPQEALVFQEIRNNILRRDNVDDWFNININLTSQTLGYYDVSIDDYIDFYIGDEPLYKNYLSKLTMIPYSTKLFVDNITFREISVKLYSMDAEISIQYETGSCTSPKDA